MKDSQNSRGTFDLAEKIALDDFDTLVEEHEFSDTYNHKKKMFMEKIKNQGGQPKARRKKNRLLIATAVLLIGLPTTAFGAVKVYDMMVQKQNYEVDISVTNTEINHHDKWYKMKVNSLPDNMEVIKNTDDMKYSFKENYAKGGFSFILWRLGENSDFQTLYANDYEEKEINCKKAVIIHKDSGNDSTMFDRQVYLLFEKEGIMLESYIGADVNEELMVEVLGNISLEPSSKEEASLITDYKEAPIMDTNELEARKIIPLKKDSNSLFHIGDVVPVTKDVLHNGGNSTTNKLDSLEFVVEKVEVFDSIRNFKQENFNNFIVDRLNEYSVLNQQKNLNPYNRNIYKSGNGIDSIDELVETQSVDVKFIYLTTTVKNVGNQATEEIYMHPSLTVLKLENDGWTYVKDNEFYEESIISNEVDYLEPHGNGKGFYNIGSIQPGQTKRVNLGYFVDEDKLNSIFLDAFHYSGPSEDLNKDRWWIDLRQ